MGPASLYGGASSSTTSQPLNIDCYGVVTFVVQLLKFSIVQDRQHFGLPFTLLIFTWFRKLKFCELFKHSKNSCQARLFLKNSSIYEQSMQHTAVEFILRACSSSCSSTAGQWPVHGHPGDSSAGYGSHWLVYKTPSGHPGTPPSHPGT